MIIKKVSPLTSHAAQDLLLLKELLSMVVAGEMKMKTWMNCQLK